VPWTQSISEKKQSCASDWRTGLSLNNPGRFQLMDLAEEFRQRAKELETEAVPATATLSGKEIGGLKR
jgi:hypothetical protein